MDSISQKIVCFLACKATIKRSEKLTAQEAKNLVEKLQAAPKNYTCPHGRPTKVEIKLSELNRWFKRS